MTEFSKGDIVRSLCGHDKGGFFVVIDVMKDGVIICDGKRRKAGKRKKKNYRHVQAAGLHTDIINNVPKYAADANIRREIKRLVLNK